VTTEGSPGFATLTLLIADSAQNSCRTIHVNRGFSNTEIAAALPDSAERLLAKIHRPYRGLIFVEKLRQIVDAVSQRITM
jgi:hypothetical protein